MHQWNGEGKSQIQLKETLVDQFKYLTNSLVQNLKHYFVRCWVLNLNMLLSKKIKTMISYLRNNEYVMYFFYSFTIFIFTFTFVT